MYTGIKNIHNYLGAIAFCITRKANQRDEPVKTVSEYNLVHDEGETSSNPISLCIFFFTFFLLISLFFLIFIDSLVKGEVIVPFFQTVLFYISCVSTYTTI